MTKSESCETAARSGGTCTRTTVRTDLRTICDRLFTDLTDLIARVDAIPLEEDASARRPDRVRPAPTADDQLAAAWHWWIDQQDSRR